MIKLGVANSVFMLASRRVAGDWSVKPAELHDLGLDRQTLA